MFIIDTHLISPSLLWPDVTLVNRDSKSTGLCAPGSTDSCSTIDLVHKIPFIWGAGDKWGGNMHNLLHIFLWSNPEAVHWWT